MQKVSILGLMSGTSLDGLDLALCEFYKQNANWKYDLIAVENIKYDNHMQTLLSNAHNLASTDLQKLDAFFAKYCSDSLIDFMKKTKKPDYISSHGHTVFHDPSNSYTLQIGKGEYIAKHCGLPVISDFRLGDVALGGQGAPLVPVGDKLLFYEYDACLNLGGFSNISFDKNDIRLAYDISPVNIALNYFTRKINLDYDNRGEIAKSGKCISELLQKLNTLEYYNLQHPKSLSREWLESEFLPIVNEFENEQIEDILNTLIIHIAEQISASLENHKNVLVTGGGTYNEYLINEILQRTSANLVIPEDDLINYKEAIIFAFLGMLRINGEINALASVTGASRNSCCGNLSLP